MPASEAGGGGVLDLTNAHLRDLSSVELSADLSVRPAIAAAARPPERRSRS